MDRTRIMGVVNVTPDSFYDGGEYNETSQAVHRAQTLIEEGADIIDVGGESTRPGADPVPVNEEQQRVVPVVEQLADTDTTVSIDTRKPAVAEAALAAGADIVNDVTGLQDDAMKQVVADHRCRCIVMDSVTAPVEPGNMIDADDVVTAVKDRLRERVQAAIAAGITEDQIIVDPGIGFGKGKQGDRALIARMDACQELGYPVLVGASRKSFLGDITGLPSEERLEASIAAHVIAAWHGTDIIRTHDVEATKRALQVVDAVAMER